MSSRIWSGMLLLIFGVVSLAWSQSSPNRPAGPDLPVGATPGAQSEGSKGMTPDTRPLSGAEQLSLGTPAEKGSMFQPQFSVAQMFDSYPTVQQGTDYQPVTVLSGRFELDQRAQSEQLSLSYLGTGIVYAKNSRFNTQFHSAYIGQAFNLRRWRVLLSDQVAYSPESAFGYGLGGFGGFGLPGGGLNANYIPNQSILTGFSTRIDNVVVGQLSYRAGLHSTITASASYGLLHFLEGGRLDSNQITTTAGYDRSLTARDTIGISYSHNFFQYAESGSGSFETHAASLSYGRRITGRLSLRLSAGPQLYTFDSVSTTPSERKLTYTADGNLLYERGKTDVSISAFRGATGGSGVFSGAETYQAIASVSRSLGRSWQTYVSGGYAHNKWTMGGAALNTVYGGVGLRRALGRNAGVYFNYNALRQTGLAACVGLTCDSGPVRHVMGAGLDFGFAPIRLH